MFSLILAILFWLAGIALMFAGYILTRKIKTAGKKLLIHAEHEKGKDNSASIAMTIEGKMLKYTPSFLVQVITNISGSILITFGFVALAFYIH